MKVLKVIGKIICAFIPVIAVWVYIAVFPMNYMDGEYSYYNQARDYRMGKTDLEPADVIILGDSRAKSAFIPEKFDQEGVSDNCMSLAQGGSTSVEAYYALKEYLEHNPIPQKVILSECSYHFTSFDGFWTRTVYFDAISFSDVKEVIDTAWKNGETESLKAAGGDGLITLLEYKIKSPTKYMAPVINSIGQNRREINEKAYKEMEESKGFKTFVSWWPNSTESDMEELVILKTLDQYYRKIIDLCVENNIEIYSANMPLISTTYEECEKIRRPFSEYYQKLKTDYPEKNYPDVHIETEFPNYGEQYFDDADHLNRKGAEKYTEWFIKNYLKEES